MSERDLLQLIEASIIRKVDAERTATGVVLVPGEDGEAEQIRATAHAFLAGQRKLRADGVPARAIRAVESYVAPVDLRIAGQRVIKGSWVLAVRVLDDTLWRKIQRGRSGFGVSALSKVQWGVRVARLRLKAKQKSAIEQQLAALLRQSVEVMNRVRDAEVDEAALPCTELSGKFRNLSEGFARLAGSGAVEKAGRKISRSRADRFRKALKILLALASEFGLEHRRIFKALQGAGFELPDDVDASQADEWPGDLNAEDRESG